MVPPRIFNGPSLMGFSGIACRAGMLRELQPVSAEFCFLADDMVITHYANRHGFRKVKLLKRNREQSSTASHDKTSINAFHKKNGFSINGKCIWQLATSTIWSAVSGTSSVQ